MKGSKEILGGARSRDVESNTGSVMCCQDVRPSVISSIVSWPSVAEHHFSHVGQRDTLI